MFSHMFTDTPILSLSVYLQTPSYTHLILPFFISSFLFGTDFFAINSFSFIYLSSSFFCSRSIPIPLEPAHPLSFSLLQLFPIFYLLCLLLMRRRYLPEFETVFCTTKTSIRHTYTHYLPSCNLPPNLIRCGGGGGEVIVRCMSLGVSQ